MMQPITTNMTEQVKVGLGQDFFHTDCRREDTHTAYVGVTPGVQTVAMTA
jgi:hypothetical protein